MTRPQVGSNERLWKVRRRDAKPVGMTDPIQRGFFAIGAEGISKPMNMGNLVRSAHAFGASFVFLIHAHYSVKASKSDTSHSHHQLPVYDYPDVASMQLPRACSVVGVELLDDAVDLPSFRHPRQAAYVFGPERGSLSQDMLGRCDHVIRIPTRFCINLAVAGAIVMYDRVRSLGCYPDRPVAPGGPLELLAVGGKAPRSAAGTRRTLLPG